MSAALLIVSEAASRRLHAVTNDTHIVRRHRYLEEERLRTNGFIPLETHTHVRIGRKIELTHRRPHEWCRDSYAVVAYVLFRIPNAPLQVTVYCMTCRMCFVP